MMRRILASDAFGIAALAAAVGVAVATGIAGVGRSGFSGHDMVYFYGAGRCWLLGLDPYDPATLQANAGAFMDGRFFFYPPQIGPLSVFLGLFPFEVARTLVQFLNLASAGVLSWLCVRAVPAPEGTGPSPRARWLIPALIVGSPFTSHVIWMGQSSLIAAALLVGGWTLAGRGKRLAGGMLIGLSTLKPQMAFLPIVWLLLTMQWKTLVAGGVTAVVAALPGIRVSGPVGVWRDWLGTLSRVDLCPDSMPGTPHLFSIHNVFASMGVMLPSFIPLAIVATLALWWYRSRVASDVILPLLMGATALFGFASDYDLVALAPMIPVFWIRLKGRDHAAWGACLLLLVLFLPQRIVLGTGVGLLIHFRVFVVLFLTLWLLRLGLQEEVVKPTPLPENQPG